MAVRGQPREHGVPVGGADAVGVDQQHLWRRPSEQPIGERFRPRDRDADRGEIVLPHVVDRRGVAAGHGVGPPPIERPVRPVERDRHVAQATGRERRADRLDLLRRVAFLQIRKAVQPQRALARRQPGRERRPRRRDIGQVRLGRQRRVARMRVRVAADLVAVVEPALEERLVVRRLHVAGDHEGDRRDAVLLQHREQRLGRRPPGGGVAARRGARQRQIVHGDEQRPAGRRRRAPAPVRRAVPPASTSAPSSAIPASVADRALMRRGRRRSRPPRSRPACRDRRARSPRPSPSPGGWRRRLRRARGRSPPSRARC